MGRFADLLAHDGVEEDLELRSTFGFLAFHGGNLEVGTDLVAARAAELAGASLYAVRQPSTSVGTCRRREVTPDESPALRLVPRPRRRGRRAARLRPRRHVDHPAARGRTQPTPRRPRRRASAGRLPGYEIVDALEAIPRELRGIHEDNPVNGCASAGVQLELPPRSAAGRRTGPTSPTTTRSRTSSWRALAVAHLADPDPHGLRD